MIDYSEKRLLVKSAHMYYGENKTQQEIANKLGISRPSVSRILQKAKDEGIVEINIKYDGSYIMLEDELAKKYDISEVIVTPSEKGNGLKKILAEATARYLHRSLKNGQTVGVAWGSTLSYVTEFLQNEPHLDLVFVPLNGGAGQSSSDIQANQIVIDMAKSFGANWHLFHAPAIVDSKNLKESILSDSSTMRVLKMAEQANVAIIGLGAPNSPSSTILGTHYLTEKDLHDLNRGGVACDCCWQFLDKYGRLCPVEINDRVIAVSVDKIKQIPLVIGVGGGSEKHVAVLSILRGEYLDVLITDEETANFLMEQE